MTLKKPEDLKPGDVVQESALSLSGGPLKIRTVGEVSEVVARKTYWVVTMTNGRTKTYAQGAYAEVGGA